MKKKYTTPVIAVEKYELTQAIAACDKKIGFLDSECVLDDPDSTVEMQSFAYSNWFIECEFVAEGMEEDDGLCYHTNVNTAFNS